MNLLLDTHILLWALTDNPNLSPKARDYILNNKIYYSVLSLWEVELKNMVRPDSIAVSAKEISYYCSMSGYEMLSLKQEAVFNLPSLKRRENTPPHKDPFDRMLICQAIADNMTLLTHDKKLADYNTKNVILV